MRIKSLKLNDVFNIKSIDVGFKASDNVICVIDKSENPFEAHAFLRIMESVFLNTFYAADYLCENGTKTWKNIAIKS